MEKVLARLQVLHSTCTDAAFCYCATPANSTFQETALENNYYNFVNLVFGIAALISL